MDALNRCRPHSLMVLFLLIVAPMTTLRGQGSCSTETKRVVACVVEGAVAQFASDPLSTSCTGSEVCRRIREGDYLKWANSSAACGHLSSVPRDVKSAVLAAFGCAAELASSTMDDASTPAAVYAALCNASAYGQQAIKKMLGATTCYVGDAVYRALTGDISRNVFKEYPNYYDIPIQQHVACVDSSNALAGNLEADGGCRFNAVGARKETFLVVAENDGANLVLTPGPSVANAGSCSQVDSADIDDWRIRADLCHSLYELKPVRQAFDTARYERCKWYGDVVDFNPIVPALEVSSDEVALAAGTSVEVKGECRTSRQTQNMTLRVPGVIGQEVSYPLIVDASSGERSAARLSRTLEFHKRLSRLDLLCTLQKKAYPSVSDCIRGVLADYTVSMKSFYPSQFQITGWSRGQTLKTDLIGSRYSKIGNFTPPPQFLTRRTSSGAVFEMAAINVGDVTELKTGPIPDFGPRVVPPCKVTVQITRDFDGGVYFVPIDGDLAHKQRFPVHSGKSQTFSPPLETVLTLRRIEGSGSSRYYVYAAGSQAATGAPVCF